MFGGERSGEASDQNDKLVNICGFGNGYTMHVKIITNPLGQDGHCPVLGHCYFPNLTTQTTSLLQMLQMV